MNIKFFAGISLFVTPALADNSQSTVNQNGTSNGATIDQTGSERQPFDGQPVRRRADVRHHADGQ